MNRARTAGLAVSLTAALATAAAAQAAQGQTQHNGSLVSDGHTRIADPKLAGGGATATFHLATPGVSFAAKADVVGPLGTLKTVWTGTLTGGAAPTTVAWDGTDAAGKYVPTGSYTLRVGPAAGSGPHLTLPISVVRLGVTEIEFQDSGADDEWQMVYFKKGTTDGVFFATPAVHEYLNTKSPGQVSDLDRDDGSPRPPVPVHTQTDVPVMDGSEYELERYNYPASYIRGASPRLELTLGNGGTTATGLPMSAGYPVAGLDLRLVADFGGGLTDVTGPVSPGGTAVVDAPALSPEVGRYSLSVTYRWQYKATGAASWSDVLGSASTSHRIYTLLSAPKFVAGASGTQYAGPWVEVAEDFATWKSGLGLGTATDSGVVQTFVKGFFGQVPGVPTSIEGMIYDAYPLGGDGGATHYFQSFPAAMDLSALLNAHAKGTYMNCTDCMGATTTMLSMLGVANVQPLRLGPMTLKAIWGIGSPGYTTALWGTSHSFSYHHIVTRSAGVDVIDTCMQLDEDGTPGATPGIPGWITDRPWAGAGGYNDLSAYNPVTKSLETLPGLL
jgi:hypothetical protein